MAPTKVALQSEHHHMHHPSEDPVALAIVVVATIEVARPFARQ